MTNPLNDSDYVTFTRRWVADTVETMGIEELRDFARTALHEDMEEILQYQSQRAVFEEMIAWDEDVFLDDAKDFDLEFEGVE